MNVEYSHWYWVAEIPTSICNAIIEEGEQQSLFDGSIFGEEAIDFTKRKSKIAWLRERWLQNLFWPYIVEANKEAGWNFVIDRFESFQYTTYIAPDDHYTWHVDMSEKPQLSNGEMLMRKLSMSVQLSPPSAYEGGELQQGIINWRAATIEPKTLDNASAQGSIIVFPSFVLHKVTPVVEGKRSSLVGWVVGPPFA